MLPDEEMTRVTTNVMPSGEERMQFDNSRKRRPSKTGGWKKFYVFDFNMKYRPDVIKLTNAAAIDLRAPEGQSCGFRALPEAPRLVVEHKKGSRALLDISLPYLGDGKFYVSARLKSVIERLDPNSCRFVECKATMSDGTPGPEYWICDVVRVLEAFDEEYSSFVRIRRPGQDWLYSIDYPYPLFIKDDVVDNAHLFRLKLPGRPIVTRPYCDETLRALCKEAGVTGIDFRRTDKW